MEDLRNRLAMAEQLIRDHLSEVSPNEFKQVLEEIDHANEHMMSYMVDSGRIP